MMKLSTRENEVLRRRAMPPPFARFILLRTFLLSQLVSASMFYRIWDYKKNCVGSSCDENSCTGDGSGENICGLACESAGHEPSAAGDDKHDKWIDVLSIDWGAQASGESSRQSAHLGSTGKSQRRRGSVVVEDVRLSMEFEKCTPKLQEAAMKGKVFPKVEIDLTACYDCTSSRTTSSRPADHICNAGGGTADAARATYLKYELKNVMVTSISVNHRRTPQGRDQCPPPGALPGNDEAGPPTVVVGNNFEEIKVTYTEYDREGNKGGNAETTWKVEKGEKLRAM